MAMEAGPSPKRNSDHSLEGQLGTLNLGALNGILGKQVSVGTTEPFPQQQQHHQPKAGSANDDKVGTNDVAGTNGVDSSDDDEREWVVHGSHHRGRRSKAKRAQNGSQESLSHHGMEPSPPPPPPQPSSSSLPLAPLPRPEQQYGLDVDCSRLKVGDMVADAVPFVSWRTVVEYPNNFIGKKNRPRAMPFFAVILEENCWDFFYYYYVHEPETEPQIAVPTYQFEAFLDTINRELGTALVIPEGVSSERFCCTFDGVLGCPKPRYLMRSTKLGDLERAKANLPPILDEDLEPFKQPYSGPDGGGPDCVARKAWLRLSGQSGSTDKAAKARLRQELRLKKKGGMMEQAQILLGLRPLLRQDGGSRRVVFVCMDLEALEFPPHPISEVGIAILDSERIVDGIAPGPIGTDWWTFIEAHHMRVKEHFGMRNSRFVQGCPGAFNFGKSTVPAMKDVAVAVRHVLDPYTSTGRELVFVAHDATSDVRLLKKLDLDVLDLPGMTKDELDTKDMHEVWVSGQTGRSLSTVLGDLGIHATDLHNAGNDAVFTMRAMIALAVEQTRKEDAAARGSKYVPEMWADREDRRDFSRIGVLSNED